MPKRRKEGEEEVASSTPRKSRRVAHNDSPSTSAATTPSNRKSILKGTPSNLRHREIVDAEATPTSLRKVLFSTPAEKEGAVNTVRHDETPTAVRNDRSARRKSARTLPRQPAQDDSEDEGAAQEAELAKEILSDEEPSEDEDVIGLQHSQPPTDADTPSKRPRGRPRGRPKKERTPSPPPDLPPHEIYFFQNRTGANKTSANTLAPNALLNHEDYHNAIGAYKDPHEADIDRLKALHKRASGQWMFELQEGFNLCLYGYGSKRNLVMDFADHIYQTEPKPPKIVVVNGYTPALTLRDILTALASTLLPASMKLPLQPAGLLDLIITHLTASAPAVPLLLIIHSLDHPNLRKHQSILASLAAHPAISLLATVDTPNFALLWPTPLLRSFNWLYHDCTTFEPFTVEIDVVGEVNTLLGRKGRRLGGKDGVVFVLRSLPENGRALFRILVGEVLAGMDSGGISTTNGAVGGESDDEDLLGVEDEDAAAAEQNTPSRRGRGRPPKQKKVPSAKKTSQPLVEGVEYRTLYHKAVEEFVCSSELNFRTLLKEFHDHQMVESRRDALGTERLVVPMAREELEDILEELV